MRRLGMLGLGVLLALALAPAAAVASARAPTWFECGKAFKNGKAFTGHYTDKSCEAASEVASGGEYELREGIGKGKEFKGKGGRTVLHVETWLGDEKIECASIKDSGRRALPNLETGVVVTYKGCKAPGGKKCSTSGERPGEVEVEGLRGELGMIEESPAQVVGVKLESEADPGPDGELVTFACDGGLEVTVTGGLIGVQGKDVDVISKESETTDLAGQYIGERRHGASTYKPLVNPLGWAGEQAEIGEEVQADEKGEIGKLERPILKTALCGEYAEQLVGSQCTPEIYAGQDQKLLDKGEALMVKTITKAGEESTKSLLIGEFVEHENAGDAKREEITPLKFVAQRSGTVEELCFETGGYFYQGEPVETSLVLGIQEQVGGKPGKVLGEGTISGKLGLNTVGKVSGLHVPIVKGETYYLTFLPLGGAVTYWYSKAETVIYSEHHKKLTEGPPEGYEWKEEAEEAPIGMWANGS